MSRYADKTSVAADRSRAEIESTLRRYGADGFAYGWTGEASMIQFTMKGRMVRFVLPMPRRDDPDFTRTPTGRPRTASAAAASWEQATRQRWRALALVVKAKLEAVEAGIAEFETEFLGYVVLPDGSTVGDWAAPQLEAVYSTSAMPSPFALGPGS